MVGLARWRGLHCHARCANKFAWRRRIAAQQSRPQARCELAFLRPIIGVVDRERHHAARRNRHCRRGHSPHRALRRPFRPGLIDAGGRGLRVDVQVYPKVIGDAHDQRCLLLAGGKQARAWLVGGFAARRSATRRTCSHIWHGGAVARAVPGDYGARALAAGAPAQPFAVATLRRFVRGSLHLCRIEAATQAVIAKCIAPKQSSQLRRSGPEQLRNASYFRVLKRWGGHARALIGRGE